MTLRNISAEEWIAVRCMRARSMTGYDVHHIPFSRSKATKVRSYYLWPMGKQPHGALLTALTAGCPVHAAEKFLAMYEPKEPGSYQFQCPVPVAPAFLRKAVAATTA